MDYVAIDFETANEKRVSACAIGVVLVEAGAIVDKRAWLIRPFELRFAPFNTYIHGIRTEDVVDQPEFDQLWPVLKPYLEGKIVVAHNASFDLSVLRSVLDIYQLPYPQLKYYCTVCISKGVWPGLPNYRLNSVAQYLGIKFKHHDALDDAYMAAEIVRKACQTMGIASLTGLAEKLDLRSGYLYPGGYRAGSNFYHNQPKVSPAVKVPKPFVAAANQSAVKQSVLGKTFVFTGVLRAMERDEAIQKVYQLGGLTANGVKGITDYLVLGYLDPRRLKDGEKSAKLKQAESLISEGKKIKILNEEEFLQLIG